MENGTGWRRPSGRHLISLLCPGHYWTCFLRLPKELRYCFISPAPSFQSTFADPVIGVFGSSEKEEKIIAAPPLQVYGARRMLVRNNPYKKRKARRGK